MDYTVAVDSGHQAAQGLMGAAGVALAGGRRRAVVQRCGRHAVVKRLRCSSCFSGPAGADSALPRAARRRQRHTPRLCDRQQGGDPAPRPPHGAALCASGGRGTLLLRALRMLPLLACCTVCGAELGSSLQELQWGPAPATDGSGAAKTRAPNSVFLFAGCCRSALRLRRRRQRSQSRRSARCRR